MQIKTSVCQFSLISMALAQKVYDIEEIWGFWKFHIAGCNVNRHNHFGMENGSIWQYFKNTDDRELERERQIDRDII